MKQSNLLNAQFARRLFRTAFSSWQLLAVMLIVCMNVAVGSKLYAQSNTIAVKGKVMADGEPVIGATVLVKGVSTGTGYGYGWKFFTECCFESGIGSFLNRI